MCIYCGKWFRDTVVVHNLVMFFWALSSGICIITLSTLNLHKTNIVQAIFLWMFLGLGLLISICIMIASCLVNRKYVQANEHDDKHQPTHGYAVEEDFERDDENSDTDHDEKNTNLGAQGHLTNGYAPVMHVDKLGIDKQRESGTGTGMGTGIASNSNDAFEIDPIHHNSTTGTLVATASSVSVPGIGIGVASNSREETQPSIPTTQILQTLQIMQ